MTELSEIDLSVIRPVAQLGGISYDRVVETFELPRSTWKDAVKEEEWLGQLPDAGKES